MPQLTFEFQKNGESTESPVVADSLETLETLMSQCNIKFDDMQQNEEDSLSVMVEFQNEEDATKALDNLNGK